MNQRSIISWASAFGMLAIILGAMGAHALKGQLSADSLDSFNTAVRYQAWHAIALLIIGLTAYPIKNKGLIALMWVIGILLFSGSIFLLSTASITGLHWSFLGPITPLGGLFFIGGWALLFIGNILSSKK